MSEIKELAAGVLREASRKHSMSPMHTCDIMAESLEKEGLLADSPRIIRTVQELEILDPDTCTLDKYGDFDFAQDWLDEDGKLYEGHAAFLPAVVFATGAQVRAAREAMDQTNG